MTQITTSERIRIFATYWGAKVQVEKLDNKVFTLHSICEDGYLRLITKEAKLTWLPCIDCSLLLRNISALTDAEAIEVAKIATNRMIEGLTTEDFIIERIENASASIRFVDNLFEVCNIGFDGNCLVYYDEKYPKIEKRHNGQVRIIDYLRSISINIGYSTHSAQDLIDAGIVVESKL